MRTPIVLIKEVEDKVSELLMNKNIDEAVEVIMKYLARHRIIIYDKPSMVIYDFDLYKRPIVILIFNNLAISIRESNIYIEPLIKLNVTVKLPFED